MNIDELAKGGIVKIHEPDISCFLTASDDAIPRAIYDRLRQKDDLNICVITTPSEHQTFSEIKKAMESLGMPPALVRPELKKPTPAKKKSCGIRKVAEIGSKALNKKVRG